jgi:magnesium-transporting ATPase (P-type)
MRLSPDAALGALRTSRQGLSDDEAEVRRRRYGRNELPKPPGRGLLRALGSELIQFFALMLLVAAGLAFALGTPELGVAIILVIVINALFSFYQEYRAERATKALFLLLPQQAMVVRNGQRAAIPVEELVPGDVLLLREGSRISCDARVVSSGGLHVENSILTGESKSVARRGGA